MDMVLLRKLTRKSTLNFGKYADYTVDQVLTKNPIDGINYLVWVYYNSSNISFVDEILLQLGITEENRIEKPGKLSSVDTFYSYRGWCRDNRNTPTENDIHSYLKEININNKKIKGNVIRISSKISKKETLRNRNQKK